VTMLCAGTSSNKESRAFLELSFKIFCGTNGNKFPVCRSDHCSSATVFCPSISVQRTFGFRPPDSAAPKRQRTGTVQDASRIRRSLKIAPASWSAAAPRRFSNGARSSGCAGAGQGKLSA
jgi:hypothetical protein